MTTAEHENGYVDPRDIGTIIIDECVGELSPESRLAVKAFISGVKRAYRDRAYLRGQIVRTGLGDAGIMELYLAMLNAGYMKKQEKRK